VSYSHRLSWESVWWDVGLAEPLNVVRLIT
jgi:hypothetical protein